MEKISKFSPKKRRVIGIIFIILGFLALVTPFSPGSWLIFVGFELLGFRMTLWERIKLFFSKKKDD